MPGLYQRIRAAGAAWSGPGRLRQAALVMLVQVVSLCIGYALNFFLLRLLEVEVYGSYVFILNLLTLAGAVCLLGTDGLLIRQGAVLSAKEGSVRGLYASVLSWTLPAAIGGGLLLGFYFGQEGVLKGLGAPKRYLFCVLFLLLFAWLMVNQSLLQGFRKAAAAQTGERLLRPLLLLGFCLFFIWSGTRLHLAELLLAQLLVLVPVTLFSFVQLRRAGALRRAGEGVPQRVQPSGLAPFFFLSLLTLLNARVDILLLGFLGSDADVAYFSIASKYSDLGAFTLLAGNMVISPYIARLYAAGDGEGLQKLLRTWSRPVFLTGVLLLLGIVLFRGLLLEVFSVNTPEARTVLVILVAGQLINLFCGSVGLVLIMTGREKQVMTCMAISIAVHALLSLVLTPEYGATGAALASAGGLATWNVAMLILVRRNLGLNTTPL